MKFCKNEREFRRKFGKHLKFFFFNEIGKFEKNFANNRKFRKIFFNLENFINI